MTVPQLPVEVIDLVLNRSNRSRLLQEESWVAETAPPERLLRVKDLRILHIAEGTADPLMRRFPEYVDGGSVVAFNTDIHEARSQVLEWAATQCPRLVNLRLFTDLSAFRANCSAFHRFKNVIWLNIHDVDCDISSSTFGHGLSLRYVLDHLPSHFGDAYVVPWAFEVPPDYLHVSNTKVCSLDGPMVKVSRRIVDEEGKAGTAPLDLVKKRGADGVLAWHVIDPYVTTVSVTLTAARTVARTWTTTFFCSPSLDLEPLKHPAMSILYLPLELIDLIISHVARDLPQGERLEECGRLALVCRNWTERARMVAWRQLQVHVTNDAKLIDHLCQHPRLACYIHELSPSVPWAFDFVGSQRGEPLLDLLRRARPTDVTLPISHYTRRFFLAAAHALNTERLRDVTCFGAISDSDTLDDWAEGLRDMPLLRIFSVVVNGEEQDAQLVRSRNLDMRIAVRILDFTVCGNADSEAMSTLFRALFGMLADELNVCVLRVPDPSAFRLEPLKRFSFLTALFLTIEPDSATVLYRLCDEAASLPHLAGLDISHRSSVGEVHDETDIVSNVVDVAELACRLPRTLTTITFAGWTIRLCSSRRMVVFKADSVPSRYHRLRFLSKPGGETLATYVHTTSEGVGEWSLAFASPSVLATCVITAARS